MFPILLSCCPDLLYSSPTLLSYSPTLLFSSLVKHFSYLIKLFNCPTLLSCCPNLLFSCLTLLSSTPLIGFTYHETFRDENNYRNNENNYINKKNNYKITNGHAANTRLCCFGRLMCFWQSLRPHFLCRYYDRKFARSPPKPIASVVVCNGNKDSA